MVLRRMMCPSLETDAVFDAALSGNYCKRRACVSVIAVREKCDEKGAGESRSGDGGDAPLIAKNAMSGAPGTNEVRGAQG